MDLCHSWPRSVANAASAASAASAEAWDMGKFKDGECNWGFNTPEDWGFHMISGKGNQGFRQETRDFEDKDGD